MIRDRATRFFEPLKGADEDGQIDQGFRERFSRYAHLRPLRGGEAVMQARLQSRSPAILTVIRDSDTINMSSTWRAEIDGRTYDFKGDGDMSEDRQYLSFLVEAKASK